jgi:hypothetical protein
MGWNVVVTDYDLIAALRAANIVTRCGGKGRAYRLDVGDDVGWRGFRRFIEEDSPLRPPAHHYDSFALVSFLSPEVFYIAQATPHSSKQWDEKNQV